jgi:CRISPR-associated protein (TIGR03985 family)
LCAYGSTPRGEINWYKYRLDRIISKRLESYVKGSLGLRFYKETALMVLRFDRTFHQSYMQGISIHHTCTAIDIDRAATLIKQYTPNPEHRSALLQILQSRPTDDAYYQVTYRVTDYYPLRWLRALGSEVEILLPWTCDRKWP